MRISAKLKQDRMNMVVAMLHANPELSNADINIGMKKKTGMGTADRFVKECRQAFEKSKNKFKDGKNRPIKNGTNMKPLFGGPVPAGDLQQDEGRKAFAKGVDAEYTTSKKSKSEVTTRELSLEEMVKMAQPAIRNLKKIVSWTPELVAIVIMKNKDGGVVVSSKVREYAEREMPIDAD